MGYVMRWCVRYEIVAGFVEAELAPDRLIASQNVVFGHCGSKPHCPYTIFFLLCTMRAGSAMWF